jgi:hypothetical protein
MLDKLKYDSDQSREESVVVIIIRVVIAAVAVSWESVYAWAMVDQRRKAELI